MPPQLHRLSGLQPEWALGISVASLLASCCGALCVGTIAFPLVMLIISIERTVKANRDERHYNVVIKRKALYAISIAINGVGVLIAAAEIIYAWYYAATHSGAM